MPSNTTNDPRKLNRRHSVQIGDLQSHQSSAADKPMSIHPANLLTAPSVPIEGPFSDNVDTARFYCTRLVHGKDIDTNLPPFLIDEHSVQTFRLSPPGVAFCGILNTLNRTLYLCPLVPLKGSEDFPQELVKTCFITSGVAATPIVHTDMKTRTQSGTGEASHDQLAKRVNANDVAVGFTLWKGDAGEAISFSFTSRSQNTSKFGQNVTPAELEAEQRINDAAKASVKLANVGFEEKMSAFNENAAALRSAHEQEMARFEKEGREGLPPPPPMKPVRPNEKQFGYSTTKSQVATMTNINGKGVNSAGIVSLPYAIAIMDTLNRFFRRGDLGKAWEV